MKANTVKAEEKPFIPHYQMKSRTCHQCGTAIRPTYGVLIGGKTFCDYTCSKAYFTAQ